MKTLLTCFTLSLACSTPFALAQEKPRPPAVPTGIDVAGCLSYKLRDLRVIQLCEPADFINLNRADVAWFTSRPQGGGDSGGSGGSDGSGGGAK